MTTEEKRKALVEAGFTIGPRDPRVNSNYAGSFMVVEPYEDSELPTEDGRNGPWAVVGDNLAELVDNGFDFASDTYLAPAP